MNLIANALRTPDGTVLESKSRHDYREYVDANGKTYEQAVMSDPTTGHIIKKGLISIKDAKTGEVIQDYKSALSKSNTTQSRG